LSQIRFGPTTVILKEIYDLSHKLEFLTYQILVRFYQMILDIESGCNEMEMEIGGWIMF